MFTPNDATGRFSRKIWFALLLLVGWLPVIVATIYVNRNNNKR
jgi:hypothetical protein